ncbi:MAG: hypothetical protein R6V74_10755 [Lutibacter sp.]
MRNQMITRHFFLVVLSVFLYTSSYAQDRVRLKAEYVKIMNEGSYFDLQATARVNDENVNVSKIELIIYNLVGDEQVEIGKTITNMQGKSRFKLKDLNSLKADSSNTYNIDVSFAGNDAFSDTSKSIVFKDAAIEAKLVTIDSINYISATLTDKSTDSLLVGQYLKVQLQRLFKNLPIGEEFNETDEDGTVLVPLPEGIPGVDGILAFEVILSESEEFGTVKTIVKAPIGKHVVDESTFDQRTMWAPRNKTPLFLLIFPNLLTFGIWGIIIYLILNLIKINKS